MTDFLHDRPDFDQLLAVVAEQRSMDPVLVEKDYWIMHCLWGLRDQGFHYELKGGTSLSKGFGVIHRFSEDIDIRIEPPAGVHVSKGRNQDKPAHIESRRAYYDQLARIIDIPGVDRVARDMLFDDGKMRSAGIRLEYTPRVPALSGVKDGILLELGFDDTAPNRPVNISSWALDLAVAQGVDIIDNRAVDVLCYAPTYTFVEKLQTISTKFRNLEDSGQFPKNFLRHYYDVYCLLGLEEVQAFMRDPAYELRKAQRFRKNDERVVARNPAFLLADKEQRRRFAIEYRKTSALYYMGQPDFEEVLGRIAENIEAM